MTQVYVCLLHVMDGIGFDYLTGTPELVVYQNVDTAKDAISRLFEQDNRLVWRNRGAWWECAPIEPTQRYWSIHRTLFNLGS